MEASYVDDAGTPAGVASLERMAARNLDPVRKSKISTYIERGPMGDYAKRLAGGRCQICAAIGQDPIAFHKPDGSPYSEAHHVFPVSKLMAGALGVENIMVLCPHHHREIHYGTIKIERHQRTGWLLNVQGAAVEIKRWLVLS